MSGFHTQTNVARIAKMVEIVGYLQKSARSNKPEAEEIADLCAPLVDALVALGLPMGGSPAASAEEPAEPSPSPEKPARHPGSWASENNPPLYATLHDMALSAPFKDIGPALAVLTTRLDDALYEVGKGGTV